MKFKHLPIILAASLLLQTATVSGEMIIDESVAVEETQGDVLMVEDELTDTTEVTPDVETVDDGLLIVDDEEDEETPAVEPIIADPTPTTELETEKQTEVNQPVKESLVVAETEARKTKSSGAVSKKGITYTVKFYWNGGDGGKLAAQKMTYNVAAKLPVNTFYKKYYCFAGWNTKKDGTGTAYKDNQWVKNLTNKAGATVALYAQWKKTTYKNYKIAFNKNATDATGTTLKQTAVNGTSVKLWQNHFTRPYYDFAGWAKTPTGAVAFKNSQTVQYPSINKNGDTTVNLYAKWKRKTYTIIYEPNSPEGWDGRVTQTANLGANVNLQTCFYTRGGCEFAGWALEPNGPVVFKGSVRAYNSKINPNNKSTVRLYAKWKTSVGKKIRFGKVCGANCYWKVLDQKDGTYLIITEDAVAVKTFNGTGDEGSHWEDSYLRRWMNSTMLEKYFTESEREQIQTTLVDDPGFMNYEGSIKGTSPHYNDGNDTYDKAFILSEAEVIKYFPNQADRVTYASLSPDLPDGYGIPIAAVEWYVRTNLDEIHQLLVYGDGHFTLGNGKYEHWIRPAMWIKL